MKKFGFGKKDKASPGPAAQSDNPYAQQPPADDPYANDKYANMGPRTGLPSGPRGGVGLPGGPKAGNAAPPPANGYGSDRYGASGGYGGSRYENNNNAYDQGQTNSGARDPGGYGGLGRTNSASTDDNRDALFSGAQDRFAKGGLPSGPRGGKYSSASSSTYSGPPPSYSGPTVGNSNNDNNRDALFSGAQDRYAQKQNTQYGGGRYGQSGASSGAYGGYGQERELTEEEREAQEVRDINNETRAVKKDTEATTHRILKLVDETESTGLASLQRLGAQGDRLHETEKNMDISAQKNRVAEERTGELRHATRGMFAVHVSNPIGKKKRAAEREQQRMEQDHMEKDRDAETRRAKYMANQRMEGHWNKIERSEGGGSSKPDYNKYAIQDSDDEAVAEDEAFERRHEEDMNALSNGISRLHNIALAIGDEVEHQNDLIDRIGQKTDAVDDGVRRNQRRLDWAARNKKSY